MELDKIYYLDCMDGFKKLKDKSVDLIITDPPYFMPIVHYQTRKYFNRNFADLGLIEHFFADVFNEIRKITKPDGSIYIFCNGQSYPLFWWHLFKFCKNVRPLIWDKKTSINGYAWRHQHELIIFAEMPKAKPIPSGDGDILRCSAVKVDSRLHPAEKPVELIEKLISKSSKEGDVVLDCFAGSGSTLVACKQLNRKFIGFEKSLEYFEIAEKRVSEVTKRLPNFTTSIPPQGVSLRKLYD